LDGLDEVSEECSDEFIREIRRFTEDYFKNIFIVSCRIASHKYRFQGFTDVEIADFNSEQVEAFVKKWFVVVAKNEAKKGEAVANKFISAIKQPENKQIIELAVTPILLNLTCLVFQPKSKFPLKRSELYKQGLNILLIKWDEAKDVKRDNLYRYLPLENKIELLSQLAAINFEKNQYFFEESEVERFIVDYLRTLPHTQTEQSTLYINSQIVLDSIEAQHGLLVERAKGIYSFSHLTFQEYFTAKYFVDKQNWQGLATHITKKQWREVFLLTSEMVKSSDELLRLMKEKIDVLVASDNKFQQFLVWINQKSLSIETQCQPAAIRAFYLGLACSLELYPELDLDLSFARNIDNQFVFSPRMNVDIVLARNLIRSRTLTFTYVMNFDVANRSQKRARALVKDLEFNPDIVDGELKRSLQQIKEQLPNFEETESFKEWWVVNGHNWTEQLRTIIIKHCNIGQVWQFSKEQKNFLQQYYNANKLLVECLSNSEISPEARQKLEKTLFQL
jgi:predicted NACHT family NTPase